MEEQINSSNRKTMQLKLSSALTKFNESSTSDKGIRIRPLIIK